MTGGRTSPWRSDQIIASPVPANISSPRDYYLKNPNVCDPYWLGASRFIGLHMLSHLMRKKKRTAIGVKWQSGGKDAITNMEGVLHTFVTPIVRAYIHGDYEYRHGHGISTFDTVRVRCKEGYKHQCWPARSVVISGLVHLDFEYKNVMWEFLRDTDLESILVEAQVGGHCRLDKALPLFDTVLDAHTKQDRNSREYYDALIRRKLRTALLEGQGEDLKRFVKSARDEHNDVDMKQATALLEKAIVSCHDPEAIVRLLRDKWLLVSANSMDRRAGHFDQDRLSLYLMFLVFLQQVGNEHNALSAIHKRKGLRQEPSIDLPPPKSHGYVYTYDPPQIFRKALGDEGKELLSTMHAATLRYLSLARPRVFDGMRVFAYNDFGNPGALALLIKALRSLNNQQFAEAGTLAVVVVAKADMFQGPEGDLYSVTSSSSSSSYHSSSSYRSSSPPKSPDRVEAAHAAARGCWLVLHNNSDAFGNNIEYEPGTGSMDAIIGTYSSMAASLHKHDPALEGSFPPRLILYPRP